MTDRHKINKVNASIAVEHFGYSTVGREEQGVGEHVAEDNRIFSDVDVWEVTYANGTLDTLDFHLGDENVAHGLTNEVLLAVVAERIAQWQKGEHACRENAIALTKIEEALHWLGARAKRLGEAP